MTVTEFVNEQKNLLESFKHEWTRYIQGGAPQVMPPEDWDEQFEAFKETTNAKAQRDR